ncbi:hypothetical protein KUCAC02_004442 [Chaenocephalus aceratus]|uniref:Uncharacterized protein n=1 Tax=Chaenocephalus aceratus TaxID=36190 RepID=A0ACB9WZQ3_CHAAC|nr:hypothetical protein KUCAC02_004442 [Chaenocephalus aceratus]
MDTLEPGPSSKAANEESRGEEAEVPVQEEVEDHESSTDEEEAAMDSQCQGQSEAPTQDATDTEPPVVVSESWYMGECPHWEESRHCAKQRKQEKAESGAKGGRKVP